MSKSAFLLRKKNCICEKGYHEPMAHQSEQWTAVSSTKTKTKNARLPLGWVEFST